MSTGRATIPAEFVDITSSLMLRAPQPQFIHANLIMTATGAALDPSVGLNLPMMGRVIPMGGANYPDFNSQKLELSNAIASDAVTVVPDFTAKVGHTVRINRPVLAASTYSMAAREVPAGTVISQVPINITSEQASLTVKRWAGPYDNTNTRVAPIGIEVFDAGHSIHDLVKIAGFHYVADFTYFVDFVGVTLFDSVATANIIWGGTLTANNDSVAIGDSPFTFALVLRAERVLDEAHVPVFPSTGRRIMIITPYQSEQLKGDPDYQKASQFLPEMNMLYSGTYVGTVAGFDILKSATLTRTANTNTIPIHHAQAFGPGMVGVGPVSTPELCPHSNDNYGQNSLAIWVWKCAFGVLDNRFGISIRTS